MLCPACNAENPADATACAGCGKSLTRRPRRRPTSDWAETPADPEVERSNAAATRAYRVAVYGLIPGPGLVLGPVAIALAARARRRGARVPGFGGRELTTAIMLLGALITATQWAGATLVLLALSGRP